MMGMEQDAILRYGGIYTIAMAYAGTSNNKAIRKVLDVAVSDVSDDVRRAAVTALGFILCRNPTQVPRIVQLLSESYNPHVRQGAALALGVACAGTGLEVRPLFKTWVVVWTSFDLTISCVFLFFSFLFSKTISGSH